MPMQLQRDDLRHTIVAAGADRVIAFMPLPPGGRLIQAVGEIHCIGGESLHTNKAQMWPGAAYVVEMTEIDDLVGQNEDTLWDMYVPKDADVSATAGTVHTDMTRDVANQDPFEEPGEVNLNVLAGVVEPATKVWEREELVSFASSPSGRDAGSPDSYQPTEAYQVAIGGSRVLRHGGFFALALASPSFDDVTTSTSSGLSNIREVTLLRYLRESLRIALPALLGMTEAGAEIGPIDVLQMLEELVEPTVFEQTAGAYNSADYNVFSKFQIVIETPGDFNIPGIIGDD